MRRRTLFAALAAVAVGLSAVGLWSPAQEPPADAKAAVPKGEFAGKVLFVQAKGSIRAATLQEVSIRQLGGRPFLVGKAVDDDVLTKRQYFVGSQLWLPVEDIESIAAFDNLGQLRRNAGNGQ
jgi:hypothetical protein